MVGVHIHVEVSLHDVCDAHLIERTRIECITEYKTCAGVRRLEAGGVVLMIALHTSTGELVLDEFFDKKAICLFDRSIRHSASCMILHDGQHRMPQWRGRARWGRTGAVVFPLDGNAVNVHFVCAFLAMSSRCDGGVCVLR